LLGSKSVWHSVRFGNWFSNCTHWRCDRRGWGTRRWLSVLYWSFLWRPHWRILDRMCEMFQRGAQTLCWYGGRFCFWVLSGINTVLFIVVLSLYLWFLYSVTFLLVFCANYTPPQNRNTCAPN
jgi:hypothetical protein